MIVRLARLALDNWSDLDGYAVAHNMPALPTLTIDRLCNYVWWYLTRNAEQKDRDRFEEQLWLPPKGVEPKSGPWSVEAETAGFESVKKALTK